MVKRLLLLIAIASSLSIGACRKPASGSPENRALDPSESFKVSIPPPPHSTNEAEVKAFLSAMANCIAERRNSSAPYSAVDPMRYLLTFWHPIGKSSAELKEMFGKPTHISPNLIEYEITDGGGAGYVFKFAISDDRIVSCTSETTD